MIDPLTRCLMRQFGVEALSREMRRMRRSQSALCVAILDLDHFKELNDAHGHPVGDRALAMVGRVLKDGLRASDIACRYGGDEFLIVLPETSLNGAVRALENLRRRIGATTVDGSEGEASVTVAATVGITAVEPAEEDPALPIARADATMYEAKRSGRDRVGARTKSPPVGPSAAPL
jgi:diguanylate cyclase (GGDEF)-like protein